MRTRNSPPTRDDLLKYFTISSAHRILLTMGAYRRKFGHWPTSVAMDPGMFDALKREVFTPLGWEMMAAKLKLSADANGTVIASGEDGSTFNYEDVTEHALPAEDRADTWIWGIPLAN